MFGDELTFAAKREHARRIAKTAIEDVHILADIWRKQGIDESIIKDVSENVASAQREAAVAIMSWTVRGFRELDGNVVIPQVLIQSYGKDTVKLIGNAYNLAMRQGHVDPKEFQVYHREMKKIVTKLGKQHESDADMVFDRMTPVAVGRFTAALESDSPR